jgi:predicted lipid-binding transport protein (Tim44 family)
MVNQTRIPPGILPRTLLGRVAAALIAASIAVIGLFFLVFALIAAAVIGAIVIVRIWWIARKLRAQRDADVIEGSYSVQVESPPSLPAQGGEASGPRRDRG